MRFDLILVAVLIALCIFFIPVWKAVISVTVLVLIGFGIEWLLDFEGWKK